MQKKLTYEELQQKVIELEEQLTALLKLEDAAKRNEQKFRTLAETCPVGISIIKDDRYVYVNHAWEKASGYTAEEAKSLNPLEVVHPEMREQVHERAVDRILGKPVPPRYEMKGINKDGETVWFDFSAAVIPYDDDPAILSIVADITERKATEDERERMIEQLQEALAEVKTLRGILPMCSYCKKIRDDQGYWEQVEVYLSSNSSASVSHGLCPECAAREFPGVFPESIDSTDA